MCGTNGDCGPCAAKGGCGPMAAKELTPFMAKMKVKIVTDAAKKKNARKAEPGEKFGDSSEFGNGRKAAIKRRLATNR